MEKEKLSILKKDGVSYLLPFILVTSCFALWGFANDITNPMVKALLPCSYANTRIKKVS